MRILAFWTADEDRYLFEDMSALDAIDILWHKRDELGTRFYDLGVFFTFPPNSPYGIGSMSEFEDDYNDEYLDGGLWCKVFEIDKEDVKLILED